MIKVVGAAGLLGLSLSALTDTKNTVNLLAKKPDSETVNFPVRSVLNLIAMVLPGSILVAPLNSSKVKDSSPASGEINQENAENIYT